MLPVVQKNNLFTKILNKIKKIFLKQKNTYTLKVAPNNSPSVFREHLKYTVNSEIYILKMKLDSR